MFGKKNDDQPAAPDPPPLTHPAVTTCSVCGGTALTESKNAAVKIYRDVGYGYQEADYLAASMVICDRCGRVEWFAGSPSDLQGSLPSGPQDPPGAAPPT